MGSNEEKEESMTTEYHPDPIDAASALTMESTQASVTAAQEAAARIPVGEPGECELCGEHFARIVHGNCARCRDKYKLR